MRRLLCIAILLFGTFLILTPESRSQPNGWGEHFFRANQACKEGRFQDAVDEYERLIHAGHENGHIYYNLGNAYFRLERIGYAILNYERARAMIPRDADLNFNLRYARDQIQDAIEEPQDLMMMAFFWMESLNIHELFWIFVVLNVLFWGILVIRLFIRPEWTFYISIILLVFWVITGSSFGLKYFQQENDDRGVILRQEVNILAGPDVHDTVLFKLHEGTIVHHERSEEDWSLIRLPDEKRGWVKVDELERIRFF
ncbi:MAG: hypothetical protein JRJ65_00510 [Deltaproteobacteria bacterium]|nr:hypothetical protein [Deltaproteobacteria bacterium]